MPGLLIMNSSSETQTPDLKRGRAHNGDDTISNERPPDEISRVNGDYGETQARPVTVNGFVASTDDHSRSNGISHRNGPTERDPPELDQTWRQGEQNKSMGVMMDRLAQQTFLDLNEVIGKMAETGQPIDAANTNGMLPNAIDTSDGSLQQKRMILEFAKEQRDRYIKTLVLSDWSRNEEAMARLIDIKVWQDKQRFAHANAKHAVGQIKVDTVGARMPNPNIEGAMELMARGKSSWIPDLGYIPPKRLTARQLLRTLRDMNVVLATRLNLHDTVPPFMKNYRIADGRVTFTVGGEFEVDLAVADEDLSSPFYFIDLRIQFSPSPSTLGERLRGFLEGKVNQSLASHGLQGCYDFLHKLALTHKINTLRDQAADLLKGKWFDCLKIESLHRNLVIQYWVGRPGLKHWFEIGISSGHRKTAQHFSSTSHLRVRWFRAQKAVEHDLSFDWSTLNIEQCLLRIIAEHSRVLLADIRDNLQQQTKQASPASCVLRTESQSYLTSHLTLNLPSHPLPLECRIEPITGHYVLSPSTPATTFAEHRINRDAIDPSSLLLNMACSVLQEQISQYAELLHWTHASDVIKTDSKSLFGSDIRQHRLYRCHSKWPLQFALAVAVGVGGPRWWVVDVKPDGHAKSSTATRSIVRRRPLHTADANGNEPELSPDLMLRVEKLAIAEISLFSLAEDLTKIAAPVPLRMPDLNLHSAMSNRHPQNGTVAVPIFIRFSTLMNKSNDKKWAAWAKDIVRLTHHGADLDAASDSEEVVNVRHDLRLTLDRSKMHHLRRCLARRPDKDVAFNQTGGMAVRYRTPLGEPIFAALQKKLHSIERLDGQVAALQKLGYDCTSVSLSRLGLNYGRHRQLSVRMQYSADGQLPVRIKLEPDTNPHLRVRALLEQTLNLGDSGSAFVAWINTFHAVLPLLQTLEQLEGAVGESSSMSIRIRDLSRYCIKFSAPHPPLSIQIMLRMRLENQKRIVVWYIDDVTKHFDPVTKKEVPDGFSNSFKEALHKLWNESTDLWYGTGKGIVANPDGISNAVERVVEFFKNFKGVLFAAEEQSAKDQVVTATSQAQPESKTISRAKVEPQSEGNGIKKRQAGTAQDAITLD